MALLQENQGGGQYAKIEELAPVGTHVAVCGRVIDLFGVMRKKYDDPTQMEAVNVAQFGFGFIGQDGVPYRVKTRELTISGNPKSNLIKFLTGWLGAPPKMGWDYCAMEGQGAIITVAHVPSRDGTRTYANITAIRPLNDGLTDYSSMVPQVQSFDWSPFDALKAEAVKPPAPAPTQQATQQATRPPMPVPAAPRPAFPAAPQAPRPAAPQFRPPQASGSINLPQLRPAFNPAPAAPAMPPPDDGDVPF